MLKKLWILNWILFIFNIFTLVGSYFFISEGITIFNGGVNYFFRITTCFIIFLMIGILYLFQIKKESPILEDKKYLTMSICSNIITIIILLRALIDPLLPNNAILFIDYNTIFIILIYLGTFIYGLLNTKKAS